jgi:branched-subunit amino acid transport protein
MILFMGVISYVLRAIPFLIGFKKIKKDSFIIMALDYSVSFILGSIIINISLDNIKIMELIKNFNINNLISIAVIIMSYFVSKKTGSILKSLIISSVFFIFITWWISK